MTIKKLAISSFLVLILTATSQATPITCNLHGCSDWHSNASVKAPARPASSHDANGNNVRFLPHPAGCPRRAFCGCGAAVELFGKPIRSLWPSVAWFKFPRASAAPNRVAVRKGHVFVLKQHVSGDQWLVADYNSGGHRSREHVRSIRGYTIVNPHGAYASN